MSLLMEALKRAERENHKVAPDESAQERSSADLAAEPDWPPALEPLQDESSFPSLKWTEPIHGDSAPAAMTSQTASALSLEERAPEPAPAKKTTNPPIAAAEPTVSPSTNATRQQSTTPPLPPPARVVEPEPAKPPPARIEPTLQKNTPAATKLPLAPEATAAQRQQHAANVLAANTKKPGRNRLLLAAVGTMAILLLAGGAYLYWQYPQLSPAISQGKVHPAPIAPPPVAAAIAPAAPGQLDASPSPPSSKLAANVAPARKTSPSAERQASPAPAAPLAEQAPKESAITIRRSTQKDQVAPALVRGYSAFMAGNDSLAQQEYTSILRQDGNNRDALLGMAAIAAKHGHGDEAAKTYRRLQELDPRDAAAQAGMLGLAAGQADPAQSESRVKTLLAQQPDSHFLHFTLGNLYAGQSRWSEAQQAFFHAYQKAPNNPDYLYNLAISLDHLNQSKLALEYYQRALSQTAPANFDKATAQKRTLELQQMAGN